MLRGGLGMLSSLYIREIKIKPSLYESSTYINKIPVVKHRKDITLEKRVTFIVGENGSGKSTLLEAIAICAGFNPEGGGRNLNFSTYKSHSELYKHLVLTKGIIRPRDGYFLRAESFYNVASEIEALDSEPTMGNRIKDSYGGKSLHDQSHGESFMSLILNRFGGQGLYILDEPEAALSPSRQFALLAQIHQLVKENSQFIIATHSPILMAYPDADILVINEKGIQLTPYEETEHYILTKQFLDNPKGMLKYLLE